MMPMGGEFRDGVAAAGVPRMAARQTTHCQPTASEEAVTFDSGFRITGAAWIKTAMTAEKRADAVTVRTQ